MYTELLRTFPRGIGVLRRVGHLIPYYALIMMYNSIALPYFNYCSIVWGAVGRGCVTDFRPSKTELPGW